jgi:hypothetical protein
MNDLRGVPSKANLYDPDKAVERPFAWEPSYPAPSLPVPKDTGEINRYTTRQKVRKVFGREPWYETWQRLRDRGVSVEQLVTLNHPNARIRGPFPDQQRYKKPSDYRPVKEPQNIRLWWMVKRNGQELFSWVDVEYHIFKDMKASVLERVKQGKVLSDEKMRELFDTHQKHVQNVARKMYWRYRPVANRLGVFLQGRRCYDFESLMWEAIWLGKGTNTEALEFVIGAWVRDKTKAKKNQENAENAA